MEEQTTRVSAFECYSKVIPRNKRYAGNCLTSADSIEIVKDEGVNGQ